MGKYADTYFLCDPWNIIEEGWHPERNLVSESVFSLGNEYMGVRGYAEEGGGTESLRGSYLNGIYEEVQLENSAYKGIVNKTHFMVNAVDWLHTEICAAGELLDMASSGVSGFRRVLDMKKGRLLRMFDWHTRAGAVVHLRFIRFLNMEQAEEGCQEIEFSVSGGTVEIQVVLANSFNTFHGGDKKNYWRIEKREWFPRGAAVQASTLKTGQQVFSGFTMETGGNGRIRRIEAEKSAGLEIAFVLEPSRDGGPGKTERIIKRVINLAEKKRNAPAAPVWEKGLDRLTALGSRTYEETALKQQEYWKKVWEDADILIEGDEYNQQGIRFCIFQMYQTYHGYDPSNNIGAKGLTGEAYNGHTFWDTETYCLPFYLFSNLKAARNLLDYRCAALDAAKERARQLDCRGSCYPVATLNGEEGCSLWQHASLQFQASTAVAYGIRHYSGISGDREFLFDKGVEILVEISRFLESRGAWNNDGTGFGFYAVMGPDEFHMMVNHNCYTNFLAKKTFEYTEKILAELEAMFPESYAALCRKIGLDAEERRRFALCAEKMIILYDKNTGLFEQHEGYFNLPHIEISGIPAADFPLYHHWSYDRIYRTDMIKQPDVLMFLFLFRDDFSLEMIKRNYEFYEPRTIHESSLSPSIHSIFAVELGKYEEAFRFFGFATRMDLDNYNRNTSEGLHTTSIAAAWMNIVYGFGGLRSDGDVLVFNPMLPGQWKAYEFRLRYRGIRIRVRVSPEAVSFSTEDRVTEPFPLVIYGKRYCFDEAGITLPLARIMNEERTGET
ncbi:MAG: family 65 glycosyl hydrolase [Treponema sp.]|jgi:maltose phosphorylase|nr:family 65 glycosyl hydrolase [Treponema sp.]